MKFTITNMDPQPMSPGGLGPDDLVNPFHIQTEITGEDARQAILRSAEMMRADEEANRKTVPSTDYSGPAITQLQDDGSWKVIGHLVVRGGAGGYTEENVLY